MRGSPGRSRRGTPPPPGPPSISSGTSERHSPERQGPMHKRIEGSRAVAEAVAMCRPQVIGAYPITPQTHIVEALSAMVKKEDLAAGFLNVESEFAAGWLQLYAETSQEALDL